MITAKELQKLVRDGESATFDALPCIGSTAEVLRAFDYINHFGSGISRAITLSRRNGNPELEFEFKSSHAMVIIKKAAQNFALL